MKCLPGALAKNLDLGYEGAGAGSPGVWVEGNPILLSEMVRNLVDNAINYTPASQEGQPGVVTVRVLADPGQQLLVVQVEDTGPALPLTNASKSSSRFTVRWAMRPMAGPGVADRAGDCQPAWCQRHQEEVPL